MSKSAGKCGQFAVAVSAPTRHFEAAPISYVTTWYSIAISGKVPGSAIFAAPCCWPAAVAP